MTKRPDGVWNKILAFVVVSCYIFLMIKTDIFRMNIKDAMVHEFCVRIGGEVETNAD
jgi:hypothetical protein